MGYAGEAPGMGFGDDPEDIIKDEIKSEIKSELGGLARIVI